MKLLLGSAIGMLCVLPAFGLGQSKHHVVVELSNGGKHAFEMALATTANLRRAFGQEPVEIEIVCLGPGIDLILSHANSLAGRVTKAQKDGVAFAACGNTLRARQIGRDRIFGFVKIVDAGVAEIVRKQEARWSYIKR